MCCVRCTHNTRQQFENAKLNHLSKYGIVTKAVVMDKGHTTMSSRRIKSDIYTIYYSFKTSEKDSITSSNQVLKGEFSSLEKYDTILVIYSEDDFHIVDLIYSEYKANAYEDKINQFLLNK